MEKNLVIVESPAKAKTIEKFLGKEFKVRSSYGHIRDLKKKDFGVNLDTFEPQYEVPDDKRQVVSDLKSEAKKATCVWLASDEDREGEAIAWHLAEVLGLDASLTKRIVFHEITKPAIQAAIASPRRIDLHLVDAQQARRVLDRLVGFKLSPVLWRRVRPSLSAGRVQSVAVRLIVEREREIKQFQSEASYRLTALFRLPSGATFRAELNKRFATDEEARAFLEQTAAATFTISDVTTHPVRRAPAPPFTTSTLQQEAARKLGFPVSLTMRVAQSLYEAGLITYMRTDSTNLSQLCLAAAAPAIAARFGEGYCQTRRYHTHTKGAQEAHEAIRPTDMERETAGGTQQEKRLYSLIWKRTMACQMAEAQIEKTTVTITISDRSEATGEAFVATGETVKFDGFLRLYRESREDDEEEHEAASTPSPQRTEGTLLPAMAIGESVAAEEMTATERYTQHPPRYTEATLVHKLEELGIGRPSTYAPTISTIQQREYVERGDKKGSTRSVRILRREGNGGVTEETKEETYGMEKGKLLPTDTGVVVNDFLLSNFPSILDYNFTASIEKEFDEIAEGKRDWVELMRHFYSDLEPQVERALENKGAKKAGERLLGADPASGQPVYVKIGRYGPMVQVGDTSREEKPRFATLPAGRHMEEITLEEALELFRLPRALGQHEGKEVVVNVGRFGPYVRHDGQFTSIPKGKDPLTVTLAEAVDLIEAKRKAEREKHLKTFAEEPGVEVLKGRYGPYIAFEGKNYRLPKEMHARAAALTLEECRAVIEEGDKKPARRVPRSRGKK